MKRLLVTGASGLLGLNFCNFFYRKYSIIGLANHTRLFNPPFRVLSRDLEQENADSLMAEFEPEIVLHCAAIANIDTCEKQPEKAVTVNSELPGRLAAAAKKRGAKFVHISTDAVFDGEDCGEHGYRETDAVNPLSRYAETKLMGERNVLSENPDAIVARVNFYGWSMGGRRSLVEFFYNNLSEGKPMNGFSDVYFCTLYVHYLAELLDEMIEKDAKGIYHVFSSDYQSKYEFGRAVAKKFNLDADLIKPVSWKDGGLTAKRSPNLIMNTDKLRALLGHELPKQSDSLDYFYRDTAGGYRQRIQAYSYDNHSEA